MKPRKMPKIKPMTNMLPDGIVPDYKNVKELSRFLSERGKILGRARTSLTAKQQRELTQNIKRARHVALLPFIVRG
jgi:small subunit ribosomal protein S18